MKLVGGFIMRLHSEKKSWWNCFEAKHRFSVFYWVVKFLTDIIVSVLYMKKLHVLGW